jgi:hypothetical protein
MQRQVPDFLCGETTRVTCGIPKCSTAIERPPNQAGAVAVQGQQRLRDFAQLNLATEPRREVLDEIALVRGDRFGRQFSRYVDKVSPDQHVKVDAGRTHDADGTPLRHLLDDFRRDLLSVAVIAFTRGSLLPLPVVGETHNPISGALVAV